MSIGKFVCPYSFVVFQGSGDWDACVKNLTSLLTTEVANSECYALKCFLGLVRAPSISLSDVELYGFSEYWFSLEDVLSVGGPYNFTRMATKAADFCRQKWSTIQVLLQLLYFCNGIMNHSYFLIHIFLLQNR